MHRDQGSELVTLPVHLLAPAQAQLLLLHERLEKIDVAARELVGRAEFLQAAQALGSRRGAKRI